MCFQFLDGYMIRWNSTYFNHSTWEFELLIGMEPSNLSGQTWKFHILVEYLCQGLWGQSAKVLV